MFVNFGKINSYYPVGLTVWSVQPSDEALESFFFLFFFFKRVFSNIFSTVPVFEWTTRERFKYVIRLASRDDGMKAKSLSTFSFLKFGGWLRWDDTRDFIFLFCRSKHIKHNTRTTQVQLWFLAPIGHTSAEFKSELFDPHKHLISRSLKSLGSNYWNLQEKIESLRSKDTNWIQFWDGWD